MTSETTQLEPIGIRHTDKEALLEYLMGLDPWNNDIIMSVEDIDYLRILVKEDIEKNGV